MGFSEWLSLSLGLTRLPPYFPTLFASFLVCLSIHQIISPLLSRHWFPVAFGEKLKRNGQNSWSVHVVSQVHACVVVPLALWCILHGQRTSDTHWDRAFGWDDNEGYLLAIACGYFLWDSLDAVVNFSDIGFVLHGVLCGVVHFLGFRPFIVYYAARCLLWEASTIFLNIHWFLDKTGRTGSRFQFVNGILLMVTFFGVRIVYGGYISYQFILTLLEVRNELPAAYTPIYILANLILQGLNFMWFGKMISALRKRFSVDDRNVNNSNGYQAAYDGSKKSNRKINGNGILNGSGGQSST